MLPGGVKGGAPATDWRVGTLEGVMSKLLAVGTLGVFVRVGVHTRISDRKFVGKSSMVLEPI